MTATVTVCFTSLTFLLTLHLFHRKKTTIERVPITANTGTIVKLIHARKPITVEKEYCLTVTCHNSPFNEYCVDKVTSQQKLLR